MTTRYIGRGQFVGLEFTLTPTHHARTGAPGYIRTTVTPCPVIVEGLRRSAETHEKTAPEFAKALRKEAECPTEDWVELAWAAEWLANGLIKIVEGP